MTLPGETQEQKNIELTLLLSCDVLLGHIWARGYRDITVHSGQLPGIESRMEKGEKKWQVDLEEQRFQRLKFATCLLLYAYTLCLNI